MFGRSHVQMYFFVLKLLNHIRENLSFVFNLCGMNKESTDEAVTVFVDQLPCKEN